MVSVHSGHTIAIVANDNVTAASDQHSYVAAVAAAAAAVTANTFVGRKFYARLAFLIFSLFSGWPARAPPYRANLTIGALCESIICYGERGNSYPASRLSSLWLVAGGK